MEEMISEKKERDWGSSSCSNTRKYCVSQIRLTAGRRASFNDKHTGGKLTLGVLVAQRTLPHVRQFDGTLRAGIHEPVAALRVELSSCDHLCELLHVGRLDVDNVKALVLNVKVPEIYAQIIAANERFSIAVDRDAVDVVCMGVGVGPAGDGGDNGVVVCQARELEVAGVAELHSW